MLDETIELLTEQMLKDIFKNKNQKEVIKMTKTDLYNFCIKLIKLVQYCENIEDLEKSDSE